MNKTIVWNLGWKNWLCIFAAAVFISIVYWSGVAELVKRWDAQEEYSHGYMLPLITLYFLWLKKNEMVQSEFSFSWVGFFLVFISLFVLDSSIFDFFIFFCFSIISVFLI